MFGLRFFTLANFLTVSMAGVGNLFFPDAADGGDDPSTWHEEYPFCAGLNQSPVDICTDEVHPNPTLGNIVYTNFNTKSANNLELTNYKGEQAQLRGFDHTATIHSGGLPADEYRIEQLHFHVGSEDSRGSEHDINGKFFPAEMHVVFFSSDYPDYHSALNRPQGIAVLTVLFKVSSDDNDAYGPIIDKLCEVQNPGDTTTVEPLALRDLLPDHIKHFYRYRGSLTTPPCYQSVIWTIYKDLGQMSERQLNVFRDCLHTNHSIYGSHTDKLINNFRPPQPLNGRLIEENKDAYSPRHCEDDNGNGNGNGAKAKKGYIDRYRGPARCDGKKHDDNDWRERPECYDDRDRNGRNGNGKGNGKENGKGNGKENGKGNGKENGKGNGNGNGKENGKGNGKENGNGNGKENGKGNGNGNGKENGNGKGNGNGNGNGK